MAKFLLWLILLVVCWPLALLALVLYPFVWLVLLPFRLLGIAVGGAPRPREGRHLPARATAPGPGRRVRAFGTGPAPRGRGARHGAPLLRRHGRGASGALPRREALPRSRPRRLGCSPRPSARGTADGRRVSCSPPVGDVVLEAGHFLPGLLAFLSAHLAYVAAFRVGRPPAGARTRPAVPRLGHRRLRPPPPRPRRPGAARRRLRRRHLHHDVAGRRPRRRRRHAGARRRPRPRRRRRVRRERHARRRGIASRRRSPGPGGRSWSSTGSARRASRPRPCSAAVCCAKR